MPFRLFYKILRAKSTTQKSRPKGGPEKIQTHLPTQNLSNMRSITFSSTLFPVIEPRA